MMQSCASAARLLGGRPILSIGIEAMEGDGSLPPRIILALHLAGKRDQRQTGVELHMLPSSKFVHVAGRRTAPGGTLPIVT